MSAGTAAYAGVVSRGSAFGVDAVINAVALTAGAGLLRLAGETLGVRIWAEGSGVAGTAASLAGAFGLYCVAFWSLAGRTPGMALFGLRVVARDGRRPGWGRSTLRAACYALSALLLIGFVWILFDPQRQGFHDKVAGTFVVYDPAVSRAD